MPVNGLHLVSVRCLVTGKNAELKRLDGMSEKPGIISFTRIYAGCFGKTRFKQGMFKTKSVD